VKLPKTRTAILIAGTAAAVLLAVSAFAVLSSEWFHERVKQRIVWEIERATGGRAEIGFISLDWRRLRVEIRSFILHGREGASEPPLFRARSIQVGFKIRAALRKDIDIRFLRLDSPQLHIMVYEDGSTNFPGPQITRLRRDFVGELLSLAIGEILIKNGRADLGATVIPLELQGKHLQARLFIDNNGPRYTGKIAFGSVNLRMPVAQVAPLGATADLVLQKDELRFTRAWLYTGTSKIEWAGAIRWRHIPESNFHFAADCAFKDLGLPKEWGLAPEGRLRLEGKIQIQSKSKYDLESRLVATHLTVVQKGHRISGMDISSDVRVRNGLLEMNGLRASMLGGSFKGELRLENFHRLLLQGHLTDISLRHLTSLPFFADLRLGGRISGPLTAEAVLTRKGLQFTRAYGHISVTAGPGRLPVSGTLQFDYNWRSGVLSLTGVRLSTPSSVIRIEGELGQSLRISLVSNDFNELALAAEALLGRETGWPGFALQKGAVRFDGSIGGRLEYPRIAGRVVITDAVYRGCVFDRVSADIRISSDEAEVHNLIVAAHDMRLEGKLQAVLAHWRPEPHSRLNGSVSLRGLPLERIPGMIGRKVQLAGTLSGLLHLDGTPSNPDLTGKIDVRKLVFEKYGFDRVRAQVRFSPRLLQVVAGRLDVGRSFLSFSGSYTPQASKWDSGSMGFAISGKKAPLNKILAFAKEASIDGNFDLDIKGEATIVSSRVLLTALAGKVRAERLTWQGKPAGSMVFSAETKAGEIAVRAYGEFAGAKISGEVSSRVTANHPTQGELRFQDVHLASLHPVWSKWLRRLPVEAQGNVKVAFSGEAIMPASWKARVELTSLEIQPASGPLEREKLTLVSNGPTLLSVDHKGVVIERAQLAGKDTDLQIFGTFAFGQNDPLRLEARGAVNLAVLHDFDADLSASGKSTVDASIRGSLSRPQITGRLEFTGASFYLSDAPNGIEKASGVIFFTQERATIQKLTAETGGGKLSLGGFLVFGTEQVIYQLLATANQVRIRYPEGISTTINASLQLTGTSVNSTLSGTVTVLRSAVSTNVDLAALLAKSAKPLVTPATQNRLLRGMLFDIRVQTAPDARLDTAMSKDLRPEGDLRLRGSPYKPVLLGRLSFTQGEIKFLDTTYTITRGDITFLNPVKLEPVLNLDLTTRVMGTDVSITFSGPLDKLNVTYRSDPPMQPSEIIALLAVGREPANDPTVTARQAAVDRASLGPAELTSFLGEALSEPVTGRLQRLFGVSRIRIDPRRSGIEGNPQTQVALEQQVSKDVTVTYITSVGRAQAQIFRVEMNVTKQWSILAVRDENGLFGIDVLFRKQFK